MHGLSCEGCGAPLVVPNDYSVTAVRCQYCGRERVLPDAAQRMAHIERMRDDAAREAEANARAHEADAAARAAAFNNVGKTASNIGRLIVWMAIGVPALLGLSLTGIIAAVTSGNTPPASSNSDPAPAAMMAVVAKAQANSCE